MICLPKAQSLKLQELIKNKEITLEELYDMNSKQRRDIFEKHVGKESAVFVNTGFEKAIVSSQKDALAKWAEKTFRGRESEKKTMLDKINDIEEVIDLKNEDVFLEDFVASKLGINVSPEEVMKIKDLSEKANEAQQKVKSFTGVDFENDEHNNNMLNYFKQIKALDDYTASINPVPEHKVILSTIGRGNMLASPKSILLNIESNTVNGLTESLIRRMENGRISGTNFEAAAKYMKWVNKIYDETGYDITRLMDENIGVFQGEKVQSSQGPGIIRKIGRVYEDIIYKKLLGKPDVAYASFAFSDSANLTSTALAAKEGLKGEALKKRALKIFQDATQINTQNMSAEGMLVREQAMKDAFDATYTNNGMLSNFVLNSLRKPLNNIYNGVGEVVIPFAKTPANVVELTADYGGMGAVKALAKVAYSMKTGNKSILKSAMRDVLRSGVGIIAGYLFVSGIKPEDYIGEYPLNASEKALLDAKNATPNSIRFGGKWISLDYLGPLGAPVVGFLRAKKYGKEGDYKEKVKQYLSGIIQQYLRTPGIEDISKILEKTVEYIRQPKLDDFDDTVNNILNKLVDAVPPRLLPAIISDFAKITDTEQRRTDFKHPMSKVKAKIPYWNKSLPKKTTVFDDQKKTEDWWSQILFGARVKTAIDSPLLKELTDLERAGMLPSIGNPEYTKKRFKELKEQIEPEKFNQALKDYGDMTKERLSKVVVSAEYLKLSPEDRKNRLNKIIKNSSEIILNRYHYKKPVKR